MKKKKISFARGVTAIAAVAVFTCSLAWIKPFTPPEKDKSAKANTTNEVSKEKTITANLPEENQLVALLEQDGLISQINGFVVEKKQYRLFINGKQLPENIALKYISNLKTDEMRVQVFPFAERLRMHPDAGFMQVLMPVMFESPCVQNDPKKPGC